MAKLFRLYHKKRGDRATGSQRAGRWGVGLFYGALLLVGAVALTLIIQKLLVPQWRANYVYEETVAIVTDVPDPKPSAGDDMGAARDKTVTYQPQIKIEYQVDGRPYEAITYDYLRSWYADKQRATDLGNRFKVGHTYTCWYDPADPQQVVLLRGAVWWVWLLATLPGAFIVFGLVGLGRTLFQSRTSRERRADLARRVSNIELFDAEKRDVAKFPAVPGDADLKNSPGTTLAYRLPIATRPSWQLFAAALTCLFWNALVAVFVTLAVRKFATGKPDWFLTVFCVPFVAAGVWLCYYLVRQFLRTTGIGATRLEISDHPLLPAEEYELFLSQAGKLQINLLEVLLACEEEATFCQGTDTVADVKRVFEQTLLRQEDVAIQPGVPFETRCTFRVPATAMHSFKANYNCVQWKLIVRGNVAGWPDYQRIFPVIVHPKSRDSRPANSGGNGAAARVTATTVESDAS